MLKTPVENGNILSNRLIDGSESNYINILRSHFGNVSINF